MDPLKTLSAVPQLAAYVPWIVAIASILATIAKPEWGVIYRLVNTLAVNVGRARNAADPLATSRRRRNPNR